MGLRASTAGIAPTITATADEALAAANTPTRAMRLITATRTRTLYQMAPSRPLTVPTLHRRPRLPPLVKRRRRGTLSVRRPVHPRRRQFQVSWLRHQVPLL